MILKANFSRWASAASTASGAAASLAPSSLKSKGKIVQGVIDLTFHHVAGAVLRAMLKEQGYEVDVVVKPHEAMYREQEEGRVDIMLGWLEGSHGVYLDKYRERALVLNRVYEPYCYFGVPDYVPKAEVAEIADLAKPEVAETFIKRIQGITPGAGVSRFSREAVEKYGMAERGFEFFTCKETPKECFDAYEEAVAAGKNIVIPHYHPQYLHAKYNIRELVDPLNCMRGDIKDDCAPIVLRSSLESGRLDPETIAILRRLYLGNDVVSQMDYYMCVDGMTPDEAAAKWMANNPEVVAGWRNPAVYSPSERLEQLGYELPVLPAASPSALFAGAASSMTETPLSLPILQDGTTLLTPEHMHHDSTNVAKRQYEATVQIKQACLVAIAAMKGHAESEGKSLSAVKLQHLHIYLDPKEDSMDADAVIDRATDLFLDVFGESAQHSRTAVRVNGLPSGVLAAVRVAFS